jgi:polar amino acid transport system substrate-binding protein
MTPVDATARALLAKHIAPTGSLRGVINLGNRILAHQSPDGRLGGVSVDLANRLAHELGVQPTWLAVDGAAKAVSTLREGRADIGFFAIDPGRSGGIRFTAPYVLIEGAYVVPTASQIADISQVDAPGHRIVVGGGSAYDLFLTRKVQYATLVRTQTSQEVLSHTLAGGFEVAAGIKQQLQVDQARHPRTRMLPGAFMTIQQAMGMPAGLDEHAARYLAAFIEAAKADGMVAACLAHHQVEGATIAPPAAP